MIEIYFRGRLKIAEVQSRFQDHISVDDFVNLLAGNFGFKLKFKHVKPEEYFVYLDFSKVGGSKKKPPEFMLKPCVYKKR